MSLRLSLPGPTRMAAICCRSPAISASAVPSPTATTSGMAMQRWRRSRRRPHQRADRAGDIGVRQHHRVVLGAAQRLHPFVLRAAGVVDVLCDRRRADEAYRFDAPVMQQRLHRFAIAVDHVEHPRRQPGFRRQPRDIQRGGRHALGRLQHESIAARHRHRPHPQRYHRREVERRDARHHSQRLKLAPAVDARAGLFAVFALQQLRHIAGIFDILDAALQFARASLSTLPCSAVISWQMASACCSSRS